jgi:YidC/Oxa1 family membrane protein insertase
MLTLWNIFIYNPIYNILIFVAQHITFQNVGLAVIVFTVLIRLALFPVSKKGVVSQYKMKLLEPKIKALKAKGLSKEAEAQATMELYKEEKINPFSGCLYLLIQLPILIAINLVFHRGLTQPYHLYGFLNTTGLNNVFLGHDLALPLLLFAILAGVTQAIQAFIVPQPSMSSDDASSMQNQFAKSLSLQTKYILPLIIIYIATKFSAALSLYWTVANLFSIGQELYLRKTVRSKMATI